MDLNYSFLRDTEPNEMQLEMLMREVAEEALGKREAADKKFRQLIDEEIKLAIERSKSLVKND
ncbi:MAG: hypothetical protein EZS26_000091 [Candidatus Ordinivivax streblomastigis]|uniref:Uncharacterized protein n=1 Tax=Candidatus Ordinivivax streblomastigis TaxID=2540710 RepID=A0A5M8P5N2_9BACT|nr:MAG: hypothetical protein EZS26_000091 [Candidatus Ordinivivax streblomastigis]